MKNKLTLILILLPFILLLDCSGQKIGLDKIIDANQLADDYNFNIKKGDKSYKGKYLTVVGPVWQSYSNKYNEKIIIIMQKDKSFGVKCILNASAKQMERPLKIGEQVKLNGICQGLDDYVVLSSCIFIFD